MSELPKQINLADLGLVNTELPKSHQQEFNEQYISAADIEERIPVTRAAIIRKMNARFPSIKSGGTTFWKRTPDLLAFLNEWETKRAHNEF